MTTVRLETPGARLTWTGPTLAHAGGLSVCPARGVSARLVGPDSIVGTARLVGTDGLAAPLALPEETTHRVWLEALAGEPVALVADDPTLLAGLDRTADGRIVHGRVRVGALAGRVRLEVRVAGRAEAELWLTVAPTKATWDDVAAMRARVEAAAAGLSLAALRPAALAGEAGAEASPPAWLALAEAAVDALDAALASVRRRPETVADRALADVRAERLRRGSAETRRALARSPDAVVVPGRPARLSTDTPAARWLRACVRRASDRAQQILAGESRRGPSPRRDAVRARLARLAARLTAAARAEPLGSARGPAPAVAPLVVRRRADHAAAARALDRLARGLALADGPDRAPARDTSFLYETWAALAVAESAARVLGAEPPARPFGAEAAGADVRLRTGAAHAVRLVGAAGTVEVVRAPRLPSRGGLLAQTPDLLVTLAPAGRPPVRLVLDAKYRADDGVRFGTPAPPPDALGALHRYRDAIRGPDGRPGWVSVAAALFPARPGDAYAAARPWTSLAAVGVGAVPLLPGETRWLDALLSRLLGGPAAV